MKPLNVEIIRCNDTDCQQHKICRRYLDRLRGHEVRYAHSLRREDSDTCNAFLPRYCPICGEILTGKNGQIYCSRNCKQAGLYKRNREKLLKYRREYYQKNALKIKIKNAKKNIDSK